MFSASSASPGRRSSDAENPRPMNTRASVSAAPGSSATSVANVASAGRRTTVAFVSLRASSTPARLTSPSGSDAAKANESTGHVVSGGTSVRESASAGSELRIGKTVRAGVSSMAPSLSTARTSTTTSASSSPSGIGRRIVESRRAVRAQPASGAGTSPLW